MKKTLCLILVLLMVPGFLFAALGESSDGVTFEPTLTNVLDKSATEWMSTSINRAWATVLLSLDVMRVLDDEGLTPDLSQASYVGRKGLDLALIMHTQSGKGLLIIYRPSSGEAMYNTLDSAQDSAIDIAISTVCTDGSYKNSLEDILTVATELQSLISE